MNTQKQRGIYSEFFVKNPKIQELMNTQEKEDIAGPSSVQFANFNKELIPGHQPFMYESLDGLMVQVNSFLQDFKEEHNEKIQEIKSKQIYTKIEPKVLEPFEPIPGRVPRKVDIERKRISFSKIDIKKEMEQRGLKNKLLDGMEDRKINWMKLQVFDDQLFDDYSSKEWLEKARKTVCTKVQEETKNLKRNKEIHRKTTLLMKSKSKGFSITGSKVFDALEQTVSKNNLLVSSNNQKSLSSNNLNELEEVKQHHHRQSILKNQKSQQDEFNQYFADIKACNVCQQCRNIKIEVQAIWLRNKQFNIKKVIMTDYDEEKDLWSGYWLDTNMSDKFSRLIFRFYAEDPLKWLTRIENAIQKREQMNVKLKYQYLMEKMRTDDLIDLEFEQLENIKKVALELAKIKNMDIEQLIEDLKIDFKRALNSIIFDQNIIGLEAPFEIQDLKQLRQQKDQHKILKEKDLFFQNRLGTINLENKRDKFVLNRNGKNFNYQETPNFHETFKEFCFSSLFIKKESIQALQEIKSCCIRVKQKSFFQLINEKRGVKRLDEFKTIQESSISSLIKYLKINWVNDLINIIKEHFKDVGKGWFNMKETNRLTYEFGKLKRFLTFVRLIMQDTLRDLLKKSLNEFVQYFRDNVPEEIEIINDYTIKNIYRNSENKDPILSIDMIQVPNKNEFNFIFRADKIKLDILQLIEKACEEMQKIPDLEPKVLDKLHKAKKNESYVLTPILPKESPITPNPKIIPKRYPDENQWLWQLFDEFQKELDQPLGCLEEYRRAFSVHEKLLQMKPEEIIETLKGEQGNDINFIKKEITKWQSEEEKLKTKIPEEVHVSMFTVNCKEAIRILLGKYQEINKKLIELLTRKLKENSSNIQKKIQELEKQIIKEPQDIEELSSIQEFVTNELPRVIQEIKAENSQMTQIYNILESQNYKLPKDQLNKRWQLVNGPKVLMDLVGEKEKEWDRLMNRYEEQLIYDKDEFKTTIYNMNMIIESFHQQNDITNHGEMKENVENFYEKLQDMQKKGRKYNGQEALFGAEQATDYSLINDLIKKFTNYYNIWRIIDYWMENYPKWMKDPWAELDALSAEKFVDENLKLFNQSIKQIKNFQEKSNMKNSFTKLIESVDNIKTQIDDFKHKVPLLVGLKKEGMQERHWQEIIQRSGVPLKISDMMNFEQLLEQNIQEHASICIEVGEKAGREKNIENALIEMKEQWENVDFQLQLFKETQTFVVNNFETVENILDQHLSDTQALLVNPFKKPYAQEIEEWFENLLTISNVIEEWQRFQAQWCYLQPIFDSPDINRQLPKETALFKRVDATWRTTLSETKVQKNVLKICTNEGILDKFRDGNQTFDKIQNELKSYLEVKRSKFGRFYFLSNDELLSILSQTKEVENIQDHLRKVFESIAQLEFSPDKKILSMSSVEKEKIQFTNIVDPNMKQVEDWMREVEEAMVETVREKLQIAISQYKFNDRNYWIINHPGQCVLNGSQVHWTQETEQAIQKNQLSYYLDTLNEQLKKLVTIDRSQLSINHFITIEALIVIDVHAKDVVEKLFQNDVDNIQAFEWISQLRYYWENNNCRVKCLQTDFPYGYEYLGNSNRLVITPLTDKCYMTLMGALRLNLGGAPAGPAGTGKTETTKDLAKALAKQCVVFNCQESMGYQFVAKFFKGLASAGAWCCFDEFNRINLEVLSVIAQQLQVLFTAKAQQKTSLSFEGSDIKMKPTFSVFITMNPGYQGRTELPDNLKALFRPVAMMVPDYALIAEIKLYSFGFVQARILAKKMVATFRLSSEQLSSQHHYDYGMRAVTSVINAAGFIKKREIEGTPEDIILLKALQDVNVPKFLQDDLPLFRNIIKDLFPKTSEPVYDHDLLHSAIAKSCTKMKLEIQPNFVSKVLQLYDTIQVRHGLMLVGPTGGGKSSCCQVLKNSLTYLSRDHPDKFSKINMEFLNPKSISMAQLYGEYRDMNWQEGIVEIIFERAIKNQFDEYKGKENFWIMFDGPVDALWIESMNTVLDDNKKLCLSSGKVLMLSQLMVMMFEVEDLSEASPATVSRCGMVYMEPESLGNELIINNFISYLGKEFNEQTKKDLLEAIQIFVLQALEYQRKNCKEPVQTSNSNIISSFIKLLTSFIKGNEQLINDKPIDETDIDPKQRIYNLILFTSIWSIGCTVDFDGRIVMEKYYKQIIESNEEIKDMIKINNQFYDFHYIIENNTFVPWMDSRKPLELGPNVKFNEISVPTKDSIRMIELTYLLLENKCHVLTPGETGTGKSTNAIHLMLNKLSDQFNSTTLVLSAQTKPDLILDTVLNQVAKRKRGIFGPQSGKKLLLFIDDLNMPKKEQYGAQPPIELLRQYLDYQSWYIWELNKEYIKIEDLILLTAMGPPGGGRAFLTPRILRHFNIITYTTLDSQTINDIFNTLLDSFLTKFTQPIRELQNQIVTGSQNLFEKIKKELLPIPGKSHYQFNLRDLSRVFAGVCSSSNRLVQTKSDFIKLWTHEAHRVFYDRLINKEDKNYFTNTIDKIIETFQIEQDSSNNVERLIFTEFHRDSMDKEYCQVKDLNKFQEKLYELQETYNSEQMNGSMRMNLVLFMDACEHIAKICRVLRMPQGHALLLGVGGSGKQSLSKLSSFIVEFSLFQIEIVKGYNIQKWREDLKNLIYQGVVENKETTFLFNDQQIKTEEMLEDVNCLLNTGTLLQLPFNNEELKNIQDTCKSDCQKAGIIPNKINLFQMQVKKVKKNTHILVCMSPLGDAFWNRLRMFPALINCCTINWFEEWPEEALIGVAKGNLEEFEEDFQFIHPIENYIQFFKFAHKYVEKVSEKFYRDLKRRNYVTPTSYLQLLKSFKEVLVKKYQENKIAIQRLKNGIMRLEDANKNVEKLQIELEEEKPQLQKTEEDVQQMLTEVLKDKKIADEKKQLVAIQEQEAKVEKENAEQIAADVQKEVQVVEKNLQETLKEVDKLNQGHINEINSFSNPPNKIKYVFMATCILMMDQAELQTKSSWTDEEQEDYYYKTGKAKLFKDTQFLNKLKGIDFEKVEEYKIKKIEKLILKHPKRGKEWVREDMKNSNLANFCIYLVVDAAFKYNELFKKTEPLRRKHQEVLEILKKKQDELDEKNRDLKEIEKKLNYLEKVLKEKEAELKILKDRIQLCTDKLERAQKLTDLLSEENTRWKEEIQDLENKAIEIEGNSALAAAMLSYSGSFTSDYRESLEHEFFNFLSQLKVPITQNIRMIKFLGNQLQIQTWALAGLPKDETSVENGIIIDNTSRWPYLIDPQKQAGKFLKNMAKQHLEGVEYSKTKNFNFVKILEICIQGGKWLIVEDCSEVLDVVLDPILTQDVVKSAGSLSITIGDKIIPYSNSFKLFLVSNLNNPAFFPETCAKVTIINFSITQQGLIEQMLATIVILENRKLEDQKNMIVKKNAQDRQTLIQLEDRILKTLSESDQNSFLENEELIQQLAESKKTSSQIKQRVIDSKLFEKKIDIAREDYRALAKKVALLYFTINDLAKIESMYQFSLEWYENLFKYGVEMAPMSNVLEERLNHLTHHFIYLLYCNVCRSLFSQHKLIFSFLLSLSLLQNDGLLLESDAKRLYQIAPTNIAIPDNPTSYISSNIWPFFYQKLHFLGQIQDFRFLVNIFQSMPDSFKEFYQSQQINSADLPQSIQDILVKNQFYYILFVKVFRPDKLLIAVQDYIANTIGKKYVEVPNASLADIYQDSTCKTPLIILLSQGTDPKADFDQLSKEKDILDVMSISLGQGQGENAERMINQAIKSGGWVLLQNCHLAQSWMENLELICNRISSEHIHPDFRLWLTTSPISLFPVSVLQNSVRITMEPPQGIRASLLKCYLGFNEENFNEKNHNTKKLLYGLCFFHANVQNRKMFGPIGWNIPYQFTEEDLAVCLNQMESMLEEYKIIPFKVLNFVCAEINYGGRVTDDKDVRLIKSILEVYLCPQVLKDNYRLSSSGKYLSLPALDLNDYIESIKNFSLNSDPEIFGLHENAEITTNESNSIEFMKKIISIKSTESNNEDDQQGKINEIIDMIEKNMPSQFDYEAVKLKYKPYYYESMNTVLTQEVVRYNKLIKVMISQIMELKKAIKGLSVISQELEILLNSLKVYQVPQSWSHPVGFLSLKPLNSWLQDLNARVSFLQNWIDNSKPTVFWFSGFFFPQAFITGTLQNYARKKNIAIDKLGFKFNILDEIEGSEVQAPENGVLIDGIYLEGAKWDYSTHQLSDPRPKELYSSLPYVHLEPQEMEESVLDGIYLCPLYKVVSRAGQLSTTGHSTNFVMNLELPTDVASDFWIRRGVAAILSLRY